MSQSKVCLYVVGSPSDGVRRECGVFDDWFGRLFAEHDVTVEVFDGRGGALPEGQYDGVVITGSRSSLTQPEPWMEAPIEFIRQAYTARTPLLGVCFGHQLIGAAFGGSVVRNPAGWNLGPRTVEILDHGRGDPLFDGLPDRFRVNVSHQDIVLGDTLSPLNGVAVLGGYERAPVGVVAAGPSIRGVQFHPELSGKIAQHLIREHSADLAVEAEHHGRADEQPDRLIERTGDAPEGERVFHNFIRHYVVDPKVPRGARPIGATGQAVR